VGNPPTFFYKKFYKKGERIKKNVILVKILCMRREYAIKLLQKLNSNGIKYKLIKVCSTCYDLKLIEEVNPKKRNKKNEKDKEKEPSITVDSDSNDNDNSNSPATPSPEELE